jgi:hypothetical protein
MIRKKISTLTRLTLTVVALCLLAAPAHSQLKPLEQIPGKAKLQLFGDVKSVLDGQATGTLFQQVDAGDYLLALGCAAIRNNVAEQGETLFLGGTAFVKSVDPQTSYATERVEGKCWASFLAGLSPDSKPTARYSIETTEPLSVDALYRHLHRKHGALIAVTGNAHFSVLNLSAVKKPPIYGESIIGPKRADYFHPTEVVPNTDAFFYGLSLRSNSESDESTRRVFYVNPADELSTAGQSHTHCAILNKPNLDVSKIPSPTDVDSVAHVLTQSRIRSGEIAVYQLRE